VALAIWLERRLSGKRLLGALPDEIGGDEQIQHLNLLAW
jgi:hypothetical protein